MVFVASYAQKEKSDVMALQKLVSNFLTQRENRTSVLGDCKCYRKVESRAVTIFR